MKRLLPLLLLLPGACSEKVDVRITCGFFDVMQGRFAADGVDTVQVWCNPRCDISYAELRIDGVLVGVDTFPGPVAHFEWDLRQLPEASMHILQARVVLGSREYLSPELQVWVAFRSRLAADGPKKSLLVYYPDGKLWMSFQPMPDAYPSCPRLRPGGNRVVFIADHELFEATLANDPEATLAMDPEVRLLARVTNGIYGCDASPASELVAFVGYPAGTAHLFTVDSLGNQVQITHDSDFVIIDSSRFTCIENSAPVFSPDGTRLAYFRKSKCLVHGDPHRNDIRKDAFVVNSDGSNPVNLTAGLDDTDFSSFTWTFDGKWVLFRVGAGHNPHGVCAVNMSGHAIPGLFIPSAAVACSPVDSTLIYLDPDLGGRPMFWKRLAWTNDTIYAESGGLPLDLDATSYTDHIDWVRLSR